MKDYILEIKNHKYDYEYDQEPDLDILKNDISNASTSYKKRIKKFNLKIKSNTYLEEGVKKLKLLMV